MRKIYPKEFEKTVTEQPPPLKEQFRLNDSGKLTSIAWALWMQDLVNKHQLEDLLYYLQLFQPSDTVATLDIKAHDVQQLSVMQKTESASSLPDEDAMKALNALTIELRQTSKDYNDAETLCWMNS